MILMLEPRHIGEVLGGHRVLGRPVTSLLELNDAVERGLPKATRVGSGASSASARLTLMGMAFMEQLFGVDEL